MAEGDELVILESMKMEIPVEAPFAGTITAVHVAPDDQVTEGDLRRRDRRVVTEPDR